MKMRIINVYNFCDEKNTSPSFFLAMIWRRGSLIVRPCATCNEFDGIMLLFVLTNSWLRTRQACICMHNYMYNEDDGWIEDKVLEFYSGRQWRLLLPSSSWSAIKSNIIRSDVFLLVINLLTFFPISMDLSGDAAAGIRRYRHTHTRIHTDVYMDPNNPQNFSFV